MNPESRRTPPIAGTEVDTLTGMLDYHRDTLRWKCSGLTDAQLTTRLPPTSMTLAGLVLHLTMVEAGWFNMSFGGMVARPSWIEVADLGDPDWAWAHAHEFGSQQLWEWFDEATAVSDGVIATALAGRGGLDAIAANPEEPVSLRWLLVHMIEEYARHNGHADLLRQNIDGQTGD